MDLREHQSTQQRHPWEVARYRFLSGVLRVARVTRDATQVLDAGAGDAWFSQQLLGLLPDNAKIHCWDGEYTTETMRELGGRLPTALSLSPTRPTGQHDLILLLDVLEHVSDDRAFLRELVNESLSPGGWLLFSVPAWPQLFSAHDTWLHHFRRYTPASARAVLQASGLEVVHQGGLFHSLLAPRLVTVLQEKVRPPQGDFPPAIAWHQPAGVTRVVQAALDVDNAISRWSARAGVQLPGLSYWALCRRPR